MRKLGHSGEERLALPSCCLILLVLITQAKGHMKVYIGTLPQDDYDYDE